MGDTVIRGEVLTDLLQGAHPGDSEMAILQDDPVTRDQGVLDKLGSFLSLTLTQGDRIDLLLLRLCELDQEVQGV